MKDLNELDNILENIKTLCGFDCYYSLCELRTTKTNFKGNNSTGKKICCDDQDVKPQDTKGNYFYVRKKGQVKVTSNGNRVMFSRPLRLVGVYNCDCEKVNLEQLITCIMTNFTCSQIDVTAFDDIGFNVYKEETGYGGKDINAFWIDFTFKYYVPLKSDCSKPCGCGDSN